MASYEDLERRIARLENQQSTGMMVDTSFGTGLIRPFQNGFPAILTSCFDPDFGYSWAQNYLNDFEAAVEPESNPLTGNEAFTPDNNETLTPGTLGWIETDPQSRGYLFLQSPPKWYRYVNINGVLQEFVWNGVSYVYNQTLGCIACANCTTCLCVSGSGASGVTIPNTLYFRINGTDNPSGGSPGSIGSGSGGGVCATGTLTQAGCQWSGVATFSDGSTLQLLMSCNASGALQVMGFLVSCGTEDECINGVLSVLSCPGTCNTGAGSTIHPSGFSGATYTTPFCATLSLAACALTDCANATLLITSDPLFGSCTPCAGSGGSTSGGSPGSGSGASGGGPSGAGSCGLGFSGIISSGAPSGGLCISVPYDANAAVILAIGNALNSGVELLEFDALYDATADYVGLFIGPGTGLLYTLAVQTGLGTGQVFVNGGSGSLGGSGAIQVGTLTVVRCIQPGDGNAYLTSSVQWQNSPLAPNGPGTPTSAIGLTLRICNFSGGGSITSGGGGVNNFACMNLNPSNPDGWLCAQPLGNMTIAQCVATCPPTGPT
jgi:hypothetical protein